MKKVGGVVFGCAAALIMTGCSMPSKIGPVSVPFVKSKYELHYYDTDFNHTEDLITEYKGGKLTYMAYVTRYDKKTDKNGCNGKDYAEEDRGTITRTCKVQDNGTVYTDIVKMDKFDEFAEEREKYIEDEEEKVYSRLKTESGAKKVFKKLEKQFKERVEHSDENNYLIINNKKITW